ncbi:DNA-3-methyladenine glycosylase family protein [Aureimonas mangrovi]|uniref:DNA-3-methyladenine glycosylase family protein n=1 Tax=Aureimonas mangrovi TaxID=2758041 RepID=UPI00163D53E3|nr:DNA-3-methyladenine glycosylase 2 family protein [Aureimonas mangrovi]
MIETEDDIERALDALRAADPRLVKVVEIAGIVPLRRSEAGLPGFVSTIVAQQVSRASAAAIFGRLAALVALDDAAALLAATDDDFRIAGLSRPKQRTIRAIAAAIADGRLDLGRIARADAPEAIAEMTAVHGIGVWTAECHLLFAHGHEDVFPAGDLALQVAVAHAFDMPERPKEKALRAIAALWSPHRAVAARLFWAYYHAITRRDAAPAQPKVAPGTQAVGEKVAGARASSQRRRDSGR